MPSRKLIDLHVTELELHDFRSYPHAEVTLTRGATAFIGANGQGKTNLVEAIDYVAGLESHRVALDAPLIRAGTPQAVVRLDVQRGERTARATRPIAVGSWTRCSPCARHAWAACGLITTACSSSGTRC
jgi:DNA replication and repair protein RecF